MALMASAVVDAAIEFLSGIQTILPRLIAAAFFLVVAVIVVTAVRILLRRALLEIYPAERHQVAQLVVTVVTVGFWFAASLALLSILGMEEVAASLGTAAGFLALGVSYALSNVIGDTVAGLYLLRDPDFNPGDRVTTANVTGTVRTIGLRKSRLELDDGDVVVLANQAIESRWQLEA